MTSRSQPTICLISLSPLAYDGRVQRQIKYLSNHYNLIVTTYGPIPPTLRSTPNVRWYEVNPPQRYEKHLLRPLLIAARLWQPNLLYELRYWLRRDYRQAFFHLRNERADLVFINEWTSLPIGWRLAMRWGVPFIIDFHEYEPLERENERVWKWFSAPMITYILRRYAIHASATITVAPQIAAQYRKEFGLSPTVVLNAPEYTPIEDHPVNPKSIRLIHHGIARRNRQLERMIDIIRLCDARYHLYLMLLEFADEPEYIQKLRKYADQVAPNRVTFLPPVEPDRIVPTIAAYDIGFFLLEPTNYNYRFALPNKLFAFIHAGLAVCIGPTPNMAAFVREWQCGVVAPSFHPAEVAATLNRLRVDDIQAMRCAARTAAAKINAASEMAEVVEICDRSLQRR